MIKEKKYIVKNRNMQAEIEAHEDKENKSIIKLNPGWPLYRKYNDKMSKLGAVLTEEFFSQKRLWCV